MRLQPQTVSFLSYLRQNKPIRDRISAPPHRTMLYAGHFTKAAWQELDDYRSNTPIGQFVTLPDALVRIPGEGKDLNLLSTVQLLEKQVPWQPDGFTIWRALSGIFAANAIGHVYLYVGSGVDTKTKVFAATEIRVLAKNQKLHPVMKRAVQHLLNCVNSRQSDINFGYLPIQWPE
jgi:hypothetical protein